MAYCRCITFFLAFELVCVPVCSDLICFCRKFQRLCNPVYGLCVQWTLTAHTNLMFLMEIANFQIFSGSVWPCIFNEPGQTHKPYASSGNSNAMKSTVQVASHCAGNQDESMTGRDSFFPLVHSPAASSSPSPPPPPPTFEKFDSSAILGMNCCNRRRQITLQT